MKIIRTFLLLSSLVGLTGCLGTEQPPKTEYVFRAIPDALLKDCEGTPPPAKNAYLEASQDQREDMWVTTYLRQEVSRKLCNNDKKGLRTWNEEQKTLYQKSKEAP
jgi:hypothetical protein